MRPLDAELRRQAAEMDYEVAEAVARPMVPETISADLTDLLQPDWYLAHNPDVAAAGIDVLAHYVSAGRREARLPCPEADLVGGLGLIEPATVARTMPDVVAAGAGLATHFCSHGWREQRRSNPYFDPAGIRHAIPCRTA